MSLLCTEINKFSQVKALVVGDIMLDKFEYGKVERISPEAPVPVFKFSHEKIMLGGAGNVVSNLISLGCKTTFLGIIGKDEGGKTISSLLERTGAHSHLLKLNNYRTSIKTRLIAGNNHLLRADIEENVPIISKQLPKFKKILMQAIKNVDIVLISDYNKGLLTTLTTQMIIDVCRFFNKVVLIDPKGEDYSKYAGATLVKPNLKEFSEATGMKYNPKDADFLEQIKKGAQSLFSSYQIENLLITLSEHGMMYVPAEEINNITQIPTEAKEVFDVSGAGDTSLATLGAALGAKISIKNAMKLANLASGIVVGKLGTATVTSDELKSALSKKEILSNGWKQKKKIITLSQAEEIVKKLKSDKKKISFTYGCFDTYSLENLNLLMKGRKNSDALIVALNSDNSLKKNQGITQDEKVRAMLLASLEFIDYVIVFDDISPISILNVLRPDLMVAPTPASKKWPEGEFVSNYGGKLLLINQTDEV